MGQWHGTQFLTMTIALPNVVMSHSTKYINQVCTVLSLATILDVEKPLEKYHCT